MLRTALRVAPAVRAACAPASALRAASARSMSTFYTREHEYAKIDGNTATCGISNHAQGQLGDVVYASLPDVGDEFDAGDVAASVESVKAASDVYAPVSGTVVAVNEELNDNPGLINEDAEGTGWFFKLELKDAGETSSLMDSAAYEAFTEEDDH